jgi:hypothetical protein
VEYIRRKRGPLNCSVMPQRKTIECSREVNLPDLRF